MERGRATWGQINGCRGRGGVGGTLVVSRNGTTWQRGTGYP